MRAILRHAPLWALFWSALARGQAPPPPVSPAPLPAPPLPPPAPVSGEGTPVRQPDTGGLPAVPPLDQGPDTLPSLDEEPAVAPKPAARKKRVKPPPANKPALPIRAQRRLVLVGELGWNGLAGFGAIVSLHANPHLTFDLGAGLAIVGGKLGLRTRYNFSERRVTPFIGVGIMGATGFEAPSRDLAANDDDSELNIELKPSAFLQTVVGIDWTARDGFTLIGTLGYAFMLTPDNVVIVTGEPTEDEKRGLDIAFRSGVVISIAIGYSFR
jgi:hypothetical protein